MPRRFPIVLVLLVGASLSLGAASPARAGWPNNPIANVPVCTSAGDQWNPVVAPDGSGGVVVAWYDWRGGNADVYAQRYDASGVAQWTAGGVLVCGATGDQTGVKVVNAGSDGTYVVWVDGRGTSTSIYAQRLSTGGVAQWTANGILVADHGTSVPQASPAVAVDYPTSLLVAWVQGSGTSADVYGQVVTRTGSRGYGASGLAVCAATTAQGAPAVANDGTTGGAIYAWQDARNGNLDIYAQRVNRSGVIAWTANGLAVCAATGDQQEPMLAYDDANGAVVSWTDLRAGNRDVYGQRLDGTGAALWTANGVAVVATTGDQWNGGLVTDGQSGAVFYSYDWRGGSADVYAQRVNSAGTPVWTANGLLVCGAATDQVATNVATDGSGGAFVTWVDSRSLVSTDIYAAHLTRQGNLVWAANGAAVCTASGNQGAPTIAMDASGGAFVAWMDQRGANRDVYAQHVDKWGYLGAQPVIARVKDVPNDQGSRDTVFCTASPNDSFPINVVSEYRVYQREPGQTTWTLVRTQAAQSLPGYSAVLTTAADSTAASNLRTSFRVDAYSTSLNATWPSDPDSGYSVDNLSPPAPAAFTGAYAAGAATLEWGASDAPDLAGYRLYRGSAAGFAPEPGCLVVEQAGTGYVDAAGAPCWYKLTAVDVHGNESAYATLLPSGTADASGSGPPRALALSPPAPNPLRTSATLRLALPRAARVRLAVFDQQGRAVRTLTAGDLPAGEHAIAWDGRGTDGRAVASALYFVRLEAEGRVITRRLAVVR